MYGNIVEMRDPEILSIIIATLNCEEKLRKTLAAIRAQKFPQDKLQILVFDGNSTDGTVRVAKEAGAQVIENPRVVPGWAKFMGLREARGRIAMFLDADEVYLTDQALAHIFACFRENPDVHMTTSSGYVSPENYPFVNSYINEFGDPFSAYVYALSKDFNYYLPTMRRRYPVARESQSGVFFDLSAVKDAPLIELYAMGSAIDLDYFEREFPHEFNDDVEFSHAFNLISSKAPLLAVAKDAQILHFSADSTKGFISKINWRIRNNIGFRRGGARGFSGRIKYQGPLTKFKKLAFLPYNFLILPVLLDAIRLAYTRRNPLYLSHHFFLSYYTACAIVWYLFLSALGWKPKLQAYGSSTKVSSTASQAERN